MDINCVTMVGKIVVIYILNMNQIETSRRKRETNWFGIRDGQKYKHHLIDRK
jgi:hypothetical protein